VANSSGGISQTNSGSMAGGMQAAIGNNNVMNNDGISSLSIPTQDEVVNLLTQVEQFIQNSNISDIEKTKFQKYLAIAKAEVEKKEPDKDLVSASLQLVAKNLETVDKTLDTSKKIFEKAVPLIKKIVIWLGSAAGNLWAMLQQ
jgi:exonuclease VII small subunit